MNMAFDEITYWKTRLKKAGKSLKGVGHKGFSEYANSLMYKRTNDALEKLLDDLHINLKSKKVLDAGAGIGSFVNTYLKRGANVTAVDISPDALQLLKKNYPAATTITSSLDSLKLSEKFDIVHCFDVLYHLTENAVWEKAVNNLGKLSKKYIFVHTYAQRWDNFLEPHHVAVDRKSSIEDILKKYGFTLTHIYPTHILFLKTPIHLLSRFLPDLFFTLDSFLLHTIKVKGIETVHIEVFEKKSK